jgi:hypothetical protein
MAIPSLSPKSNSSKSILSSTGSTTEVTSTNLPFGIYASGGSLVSSNFISGAVDQVSYTYRKLGGDVLDIELNTQQVYAAYEEAVLEYSYILNLHQAKNSISSVLGNTTGTFDHHGQLVSGIPLSSSLGDTSVALKYTRFEYGYSRRIGHGHAGELGMGDVKTIHSASLTVVDGKQDYDLQGIIATEAATRSDLPSPGGKKVTIRRIYYISPRAIWRFYGYYGGLGVVGNLMNYGQYSDDSTFQVIPVWQNKAQAAGFEDAMRTRTSHFSYELRNGKVRIFPVPDSNGPAKFWFEFQMSSDAWEETNDRKYGADGVNNMNSLPYSNIPFKNINSMGKQWIRRFALALTKEMLGQIRGKFSTVPIPGDTVTLNHAELLSQSKEEKEKLREELKVILDEITYDKLVEKEAAMSENTTKLFDDVPMGIFIG